jgi:hypothetical protein
LEIVPCTRLKLRVASAALGRCNSFAKHHDLAGCLICIPSTASHVMSGTLRRAAPSSSRNCMPEQRQPEVDHLYQANKEKARGHNWRYSMSPTIAECLEHARQCEWYAARTNDEQDRKFLIRKAKDWTKLATKKELEIRASARAAA